MVAELRAQHQVVAQRPGRQSGRAQHVVRDGLPVDRPGHRAAHPLVRQRSRTAAVQRELGVRGVRRAAHRDAVDRLDRGQRRGVDLGHVDGPGGQRRGAPVARHGGEDQPVELGPVAPPLGVAHQGGGAAAGVHVVHREGAGGGGQGVAGAVVEDRRAAGDLLGVERGEQRLPGGQRLAEGHPDLMGVLAAPDRPDVVVARVVRAEEVGVVTAERLPLRGEVGRRDGPAVAPDRLGVDPVDDDLRGVLGDAGRPQVVGVPLRAAVAVHGEQRRQGGRRDLEGRGVGPGLEGVQGVGDVVDGPAQGPAVPDRAAGGRRDVDGGGFVVGVRGRGAAGQRGRREHACGGSGSGGAPPGAGGAVHGRYLRCGGPLVAAFVAYRIY